MKGLILSIGTVAAALSLTYGLGIASASSNSARTATKVGTASSKLGRILVDRRGRTLYLFAKDTGPKSSCSGACASNWPPYTAKSKPAVSGGVPASAIKLVKRSDGAKQVTLDGHPLYYFSGDQSAGQMNGQGVDAFGAKWWVLAPSGTQVTAAPKSSSSGSSSGSSSSGGGGYSY